MWAELRLGPYLWPMVESRTHAIIVSGGSGKRMGTDTPKQFLLLEGVPVLVHTLSIFHSFDPSINIVLVLPPDSIEHWMALCKHYSVDIPHTIAEGGSERFYSVQNGLKSIGDSEGLVAIHDGVRPLVSRDTLRRCLEAAKLTGAAIPVLEVTDSLRFCNENKSKALNRKDYVTVQTPQCFSLSAIREAYNCSYNPIFTDDASVFEAKGASVQLVDGNLENIKITKPGDIELAEFFLRRRI
jgi:2-C-methyl-D-erythritol 4-phosphate cytidylyltransferase